MIAPGPVENMHPVVIGSNFIELQWSQPELINSPVQDMTNVYLTGYDVGFQTGIFIHVHGLSNIVIGYNKIVGLIGKKSRQK